MIPRLETDRLVLRAFCEEDLDAWAVLLAETFKVDVWFIPRAEWLARA
jgi:hypothetical protein